MGVLGQSFGNFTVPAEGEGFDEIKFEWQNETESTDYLRKWVLDKKLNSRIEDLTPGEWFKEKHTEWVKLFAGWQAKQKTYKNSPAKKAKDAERKKREEAAKKAEEEGKEVEEDVEMAT